MSESLSNRKADDAQAEEELKRLRALQEKVTGLVARDKERATGVLRRWLGDKKAGE